MQNDKSGGSNEKQEPSNSRELDISDDRPEDGKVTFMAHHEKLKSLVFGTKEGRLTFVSLRKRKDSENCDFESFYVGEEEARDGMRRII